MKPSSTVSAVRPPRVLQVLTCDTVGGTELMVRRLVCDMDPARVHTEVAILAPPGPIAGALAADGVPVTSLGPGRLLPFVRLARMLRRERFDIVHAYGFRGPLGVRFLARRSVVVVGVQDELPAEAEPGSLKARVTLALDRATSRFVDVYEANSRGAVRTLERAGFPRAKLRQVRNGISAAEWERSNPGEAADAPVIIFVGRMIPRKRHVDLIRAVASLRRGGNACRLLLPGDGPLRASLVELTGTLGLNGFVDLPGVLERVTVQGLLAGAHIYCHPSSHEGMPAAILEAMACGLPVVGTRANGIEDLVVDGETGLLVEIGDVEGLACALQALLDAPDLRARLGAAGRVRVETEFDLAAMTRSKTALYEALAA